MKLIILGSGTDASQIPGVKNRFPPGFLVDIGEANILFECSEAIRFRIEQAGYDFAEDIKHLAISHSHPDHYALPQFYQSIHNTRMWSGRYNIPQELNVYCPRYIAENYWQLWRLYSPNWPEGLPTPKLNFQVMPEEGPVEIGNAKLSAFKVFHAADNVDAVSYRLETKDGIFAYSGDANLSDGLKHAAKGADIFLCESSARTGGRYGKEADMHLSPRVVGEIAKQAGVKKVIIFHYTGLDPDEEIIDECKSAGFEGEVVVGKDFQEFVI